MAFTLRLLSTDFDGTVFAEFEQPPVPVVLERLIARMQSDGVTWVVNTGRDMSALMECLGRAHLSVRPDYLVLVEREIYRHEGARYVGIEDWNEPCRRDHEELFARVRGDIPELIGWVNQRYEATIYEDAYSPLCLIAATNEDADAILAHLDEYCRTVPDLTMVRNDVYARLSHGAYSKGTALGEIQRRLGIGPESTLAAGDHFNDLPMLSRDYAHHLLAPANAIDRVKATVRAQGGYISRTRCGEGVHEGLLRLTQ
jgi:hypothetical protein